MEDRSLFDEASQELRWFLVPSEAQNYLRKTCPSSCTGFLMPFSPGTHVDACNGVSSISRINLHFCSCCSLSRTLMFREFTGINGSSLCKEVGNSLCSTSDMCRLSDHEHSLAIVNPATSGYLDPAQRSKISSSASLSKDIAIDTGGEGLDLNPAGSHKGLIQQTPNSPTVSASSANSCSRAIECPARPPMQSLVHKINRNGTVRFYNPPKSIFTPAVQVRAVRLVQYCALSLLHDLFGD